MADSETQQPVDSAQQPPVHSSQQVTSTVPATRQKKPKRVAAGKAIAERTKQARETQKKKLAEADIIIITNNQLKKAEAAAAAEPDPPAADPPTKNVPIPTQWLSVISIFISVVGIYYKREEMKKVLTEKPPQAPPPPPPPPSPVDVTPPFVSPQRKGGIRPMD